MILINTKSFDVDRGKILSWRTSFSRGFANVMTLKLGQPAHRQLVGEFLTGTHKRVRLEINFRVQVLEFVGML